MSQWNSHSTPSKAQGTSQKKRWENDKIILLLDLQQLWVPTQDWVCYPSVVNTSGLAEWAFLGKLLADGGCGRESLFLSGVATGKLSMLLWVALLSCPLWGPVKLSGSQNKTEDRNQTKTGRRVWGWGERNIWG